MCSDSVLVAAVRRAPHLLLVALTAAAFATAIPNGFVWIDHWQVESGGLVARSWSEFLRAMREPLGAMPGWEGAAPYARPAVVATLSVVHALADNHPAMYHALLIGLHLCNVLLGYSCLCCLGLGVERAFLASAIFAVHPLQTAAVSWISGIADPLFAVCFLSALRLHLAASAAGGRRRTLTRAAAVGSFAIAVAAKETALVFPAIVLTAHLLCPPRSAPPGAQRAASLLRTLAPFLIVVSAALLYRVVVLHGVGGAPLGIFPFAVRLRTAPRLLLSYLSLPVRLRSLTICDDYPLSFGFDTATVSALAGCVAVLALIGWCTKRLPFAAFGLLWAIITLLPALNLVPILHYRADRFFYVPMLGWSMAATELLATLASHPRRRHAVVVAAAGMLLLLVILTAQRNRLFADDVTLFEATLRVSPSCREAHTALADAYLRAGRDADAVAHYERARSAEPGRASYAVMPKVLINLGMAQLGRRDYAAAAAAFRQAHQLQPDLLHPLFGLGIANLALGNTAEAVSWLEQAAGHSPDDPDILFNLALGYDRLQRAPEAVATYRRFLAVAPPGRTRTLAAARITALTTNTPAE